MVKDGRVQTPTPRTFSWPVELRDIVAQYGVENPEKEIDQTRYEAEDLKGGLIINITGDQFDDYDIPIYVGYLDRFHQTFDFTEASDYNGLSNYRLCDLYEKVGNICRAKKRLTFAGKILFWGLLYSIY